MQICILQVWNITIDKPQTLQDYNMPPSFGENLKFFRNERNLSRENLAELMDTNQAQIWRLESGKTNPRLETIQKICKHLKVEFSQLVPNVNEGIEGDQEFIDFYLSKNEQTRQKIRSLVKLL